MNTHDDCRKRAISCLLSNPRTLHVQEITMLIAMKVTIICVFILFCVSYTNVDRLAQAPRSVLEAGNTLVAAGLFI